ncbi:extracellular solute-binding protein [Paenibacillus qinlingensis]|uniref:extracellular solute-binding protein n=1 Tax=Paenibacillus qinlingensis TaxID=1837343 RepID=UPI0015678F98|nr:extracellular solute-binding protein [Paenibacillus qinlingensis]
MMRREIKFRYSQLATILREQILSGYLKPGQYLLSENELCKHYQLSRTSVRKSLDELLKENLIVKKPGQGTIVSPDLVIPVKQRKTLRIVAISPSHFADNAIPFIIDRFQEDHPNVDVKLLSFPSHDFWSSIRTSSEMGLNPDLIFVTDRQVMEMEDQAVTFVDLRNPLKECLPAMYPRMVSAFRREDAVIAVPVTFSTVYLAYNPNLFDTYCVPRPDPNWTQKDFIRAAQKLTVDTDGDGIVDQYGMSLHSSSSRWPVFALQNGVHFNRSAHKEPLVKTLNFIHDLLYRFRIATLSSKYPSSSEAFIHEKAGMVLTTSIELAGWKNENLGFEPQVAALPFGEQKATLLLANAFMVPTTCNDLELATQFLQIACDLDVQETISRTSPFLSVLTSVNEKLWDKDTLESLNIVHDSIENSYFQHEVFTDWTILEEMEAEMGLYWAGLESASSIAAKLQNKMIT